MLTITPEIRDQIQSHAAGTYPHECCGVLVGRSTPDGRVAVSAHPTANLNTARAHDRFELDPRDYMRIDREAREAGLDIIGIYHSHPDHPAQPSETDLAAAWPGYSYVIVSVRQGTPAEFHSFELQGEAFVQEEVRCPVS